MNNNEIPSALSILSYANGELSDLAAVTGIDWQKLHEQVTQGRTKYTRGIEINKAYRGKVCAFVSFKTSRSGIEYPVITFRTFKHGEINETFNGYQWLVDNDYVNAVGSKRPQQPKPSAPSAPRKDSDSNELNTKIRRFNAVKAQFDSALELVSVDGTYLAAKGFTDADLRPGLRFGHDANGDFIIYALGNGEQSLTGFQKIYAKPFTDFSGKERNKDFCFYPRQHGLTLKSGSYFVIGTLGSKADKLHIVEGYANGLTVHLATGAAVIVALDAGNLKPVVENLIKQGFENLVIAADNDAKPTGNPGIFSAHQAAYYTNATIVIPKLDGNKCDFDDVRLALGIDAVTTQLMLNTLPKCETQLDHFLQLIKYAPEQQLKNIVIKACTYAAMRNIYSLSTFKGSYRRIYSIARTRGIKGVTVRFYLKKYFKKRLNKISSDNSITDFSGIKRHDCTGMDNEQIVNDVISPAGKAIFFDTRPIGTGKTQMMKRVVNGEHSGEVTREVMKQYHADNGGSIEEWDRINNNPAKFNMLKAEIEAAAIEGRTTVYICHRISLTQSAAGVLSMQSYEDAPPGQRDSMAMCVNSAPKFKPAQFARVLFIDEMRQTLEHVLNGTVHNRIEVYNELVAAIKNADLVICSDADFNDFTASWLKSIANKPIHAITQQTAQTGKTIIELGDNGTVLQHAQATLQDGGNVWIATDSRAQAMKAKIYLERDITDDEVLYLTSENKGDPAQAAFLANPNTESQKYRLIIHTPVISSGISVVNHHFDKVYAMFCNVISPNEMLQTIGRVRTAKEVYVCFKAGHVKNREIDLKDFLAGEATKRTRFNLDTGKLEISDFDNLRYAAKLNRNAALNDYRRYFVILAQLKGYSFETGNMKRVRIEGLAKEAKEQTIMDILLAEPINDSEALTIDQLSAPTQDQSNSLHLHNIVKMSGKDSHEINAVDAEFYQDGGLSKVSNFELLAAEEDVLKAADNANHTTRDKISSKTSKKIIINEVVKAIGDNPITATQAAIVCELLQSHHAEISANGLGNYKAKPKSPIRQLGQFLEKFGYELIGDDSAERKSRTYKLAVNWQVYAYAANRAEKRELFDSIPEYMLDTADLMA